MLTNLHAQLREAICKGNAEFSTLHLDYGPPFGLKLSLKDTDILVNYIPKKII